MAGRYEIGETDWHGGDCLHHLEAVAELCEADQGQRQVCVQGGHHAEDSDDRHIGS